MGLFDWLFGRKPQIPSNSDDDDWKPTSMRMAESYARQNYAPPPAPSIQHISGSGDFDFEIVGESFYQDNLLAIAGPKTDAGAQFECTAHIVPEPENQYDRNAIAVFIKGRKVGHFSREDAVAWRDFLSENGYQLQTYTVDAIIVGGWIRRSGEASFGVKLDLDFY